jgi:hypothetical protein
VFGERIWNCRRMKKSVMRGFINCISKNINVTLAPRREHVWGTGDVAPPFMTSALVVDDWSAS